VLGRLVLEHDATSCVSLDKSVKLVSRLNFRYQHYFNGWKCYRAMPEPLEAAGFDQAFTVSYSSNVQRMRNNISNPDDRRDHRNGDRRQDRQIRSCVMKVLPAGLGTAIQSG
jgi:hypothetical protein